MGWKTINGRQYYYKSVRRGGRVGSEYYGCGEVAGLVAQLDAIERQEREARRRDERAALQEERRRERELDDLIAHARTAAAETLTTAGCYQHHRGEWRRGRGH